jgi:uncharacterized protein (TIGR00269 family)
VTLCSRCGRREAIVYQRHTGMRLCKNCFFEDVKQRILEQIKKYNMILPGDRILIGISGGKDSFVLLRFLPEIHTPSKLFGLMIEEGIRDYNRVETFNLIKSTCHELGIDCTITSIKEVLRYSVDEFMFFQMKKYGSIKISACTFCGIARRRILNIYARSYSMNKVATGHNLDDEVQTYLINILRGDIMRLVQLHPLSVVHSPLLIKRIKPLRTIYEYETAFIAYMENFSFQETECPYIVQRPTLRSKIRELIREIEKVNPSAQLEFLKELDNVLEPLVKIRNRDPVNLPQCVKCGEPTAPGRSTCKFCELIDSMLNTQY